MVVYEKSPAPHALPRAAHLDDEAMRILQAAGAAGAVAADARVIDGMDVVNARGRRLIRARKRPGGAGWPTANLVHQPDVEAALRAGIGRYPHVEVRAGHEVVAVAGDDAGATLSVVGRGEAYAERASWVVGCDGAHSIVRAAIGARMRAPGIPFEERWLVVDVRLHSPTQLPDRLQHVADPRRPTTYVPFAGQRRRWEFRLRAGESDDHVTRPAAVAELLRPYVDPALVDIERAAVYRFAGAVATRWRRGRLLLAGDSAHVMPPFIGQGLCAGLRDAAFLGWALAMVARGDAPAALVDAYERERLPHVVAATRLSVRAGRLTGMRPAAAAARDALVAAARRSSRLAGLLDGIVEGAPRIRSAVAGAGGAWLRPLQQPWVLAPAGQRLRLDDALGPAWAVLGLGTNPRTWAGDHPAWALAGARFLRVLLPGEALHSTGPAVRDADGEFARWAAAAGRMPMVIVVRPDRYVFGVYRAGAGRRAAADFARALGLGHG